MDREHAVGEAMIVVDLGLLEASLQPHAVVIRRIRRALLTEQIQTDAVVKVDEFPSFVFHDLHAFDESS